MYDTLMLDEPNEWVIVLNLLCSKVERFQSTTPENREHITQYPPGDSFCRRPAAIFALFCLDYFPIDNNYMISLWQAEFYYETLEDMPTHAIMQSLVNLGRLSVLQKPNRQKADMI